MNIIRWFGLAILSLPLLAFADIKDDSTGEVFPSTVTIDKGGQKFTLNATGVATRKKFFVKVYTVAHYIEGSLNPNADIFQQILQDGKAKQLTIKWVHDAPVDKVKTGFQESFQNALSADQLNQLQPDINKYIALYTQDVKSGDQHVLQWLPGGNVAVLINGKQVGTFSNKDFAVALWSLWFGPKSFVNKDKLVSLVKGG